MTRVMCVCSSAVCVCNASYHYDKHTCISLNREKHTMNVYLLLLQTLTVRTCIIKLRCADPPRLSCAAMCLSVCRAPLATLSSPRPFDLCNAFGKFTSAGVLKEFSTAIGVDASHLCLQLIQLFLQPAIVRLCVRQLSVTLLQSPRHFQIRRM